MLDRSKFKGPPPSRYFSEDRICPICEERLETDKYKFEDGSSPYIRHMHKFYYCHVECYIILYECIKKTLESNPNDFIVGSI